MEYQFVVHVIGSNCSNIFNYEATDMEVYSLANSEGS